MAEAIENAFKPPTEWSEIQAVVRAGYGRNYFPVGYEFEINDSATNKPLVWVVKGHDHHKPADTSLRHSMTLECKNIYSNSAGLSQTMRFKAPMALYYAENGLTVGTYNFTWNYATGSISAGSYQFTLSQSVPVGGQIVLGTNPSAVPITDCKISTFATVGNTDAIEKDVEVTEGSDGTNLGTVSQLSSTDVNLNCASYILWGSNNYAQSAIRQWLNSKEAAGAYWIPQTKFDRPTEAANNFKGFMFGLPQEFLDAVQPAVISCCANQTAELSNLDGTTFDLGNEYKLNDKFFLLSATELYGSEESVPDEGELLEYYKNATNTEHIKYNFSDLADGYYLRSAVHGSVSVVGYVSNTGSKSSFFASTYGAVAPACIIA